MSIGFCQYVTGTVELWYFRGSTFGQKNVSLGLAGLLLNPLRTAVPFWGQTTQTPSDLSPIVPKARLQSSRGGLTQYRWNTIGYGGTYCSNQD